MTGDYTAVPLRRDDRWTGARLQQGRVLLDHEWNLNVDADARRAAHAVRDIVGPAGVLEGSDAFSVSFATSPRDVQVQPGRMWVGGWEAHLPAALRYAGQAQADPLPASGRALVYLDVFPEHVQPGERPDDLVDPALAPVESSARTRVGFRVRVAPTTATSCAAAFAALNPASESTGTMTIDTVAPPAATDACDPPGDPFGLLPDGLFRVEVLDGGTRDTARFVWSAENGAAAVAVAGAFAGSTVTLAPSASVKFENGDLVEVSWLARRADRKRSGGAEGLVVRRWDGQAVGARTAVPALVGGTDMGLRFTAGDGAFLAGDWWGARLRSGSALGVERRTNVLSDGIAHAFAPLALVDLGAATVLLDCRPAFRPLVDLDRGSGTCTVTVHPGDDLQAAVDALPPAGGEICIAAGEYVVREPVRVTGRRRVVVTGVGPATVLRSEASETVVLFDRSEDVELRHLRVVAGTGAAVEGEGIGGAVAFLRCSGVTVADCEIACPDASVRDQACVVVRGVPEAPADRVSVESNRFEVGTWQTGVLVADVATAAVSRNRVRHVATTTARDFANGRLDLIVADLSRAIVASLPSRTPSVMVPALEQRGAIAAAPAPVAPLTEEYREHESRLATTPRSRLDEVRRFVRSALGKAAFERLSARTQKSLLGFVAAHSAAGQGIVVAGTTAGTVRVDDNVLDGVIQGIHVGVSHRQRAGREQVREVVVSRNVVHSRVPAAYRRERHAVFVGNARSVHVLDTVATLDRPGIAYGGPQPVDGIRVHGVLGPFLVVRHSSLEGFTTGVRVRPIAPVPPDGRRMWVVAETMAAGAGTSVDAPGAVAANNAR